MSIPSGAKSVTYAIDFGGSGAPSWWLSFTQRLAFGASEDTAVDAALQAGADAIVAHLQGEYPTVTISAQRRYDCTIPGDAWPA